MFLVLASLKTSLAWGVLLALSELVRAIGLDTLDPTLGAARTDARLVVRACDSFRSGVWGAWLILFLLLKLRWGIRGFLNISRSS